MYSLYIWFWDAHLSLSVYEFFLSFCDAIVFHKMKYIFYEPQDVILVHRFFNLYTTRWNGPNECYLIKKYEFMVNVTWCSITLLIHTHPPFACPRLSFYFLQLCFLFFAKKIHRSLLFTFVYSFCINLMVVQLLIIIMSHVMHILFII